MSTLIEELELAAHNFEMMAELARIQDGSVNEPARTLATNLRKRIEHVKGVRERHSHGNVDPDCAGCQMFYALTWDTP